MHDPSEARVVVYRIVLGAAVVPEGEGARLPLEATGELEPNLVVEQMVEQRATLLLGPALEVRGVAHVDVERAATRFRMRAHHGMLSHEHLQLHAGAPQALLARLGR